MADGFDRFRSELGDVSVELDRIGDLADGVAKSLSRAFRGAVLDGKSLNSVLGQVARSFADVALQAAFKPLGTLVGGLVESVLTATNPAVTPFAKGGVVALTAGFVGPRLPGADAAPLYETSGGGGGTSAGSHSRNA